MEYITAKLRTLTPVETRLLASIEAAGWWSMKAKCMSYEEQEALHFLWKSGYIEQAAYGGWKPKAGYVKPAPQPEAATILHITVGASYLLVRYTDGTNGKHLAGTPEYARFADVARGMGKGQVLRGRGPDVRFYGDIRKLVGK